MRRTLAAALVALSTALTVLPALTTPATGTTTARTVVPAGSEREPTARDVLRQAERALGLGGAGRAGSPLPDASLALRDLFLVRPELDGEDREHADALLARPTDGPNDPYQHGYTVPAKRKCQRHICLHWVPTTADAPPSAAWVRRNLTAMNNVWSFEVGTMGYRRPPGDFGVGGNDRFDVYLKELGSQGVYGYCAPEYKVPGTTYVGTSFCVLDNDFAKAQFGAPPTDTLKVTAAHEFFHAVQFGYDYHEDRWLFESTATWMEERYADDVNDNRQYLRHGQVGHPDVPLDGFFPSGSSHYGNWAFWELLTKRYGTTLVRDVWTRAGAFKGARDLYSTRALKSALVKHGGFADVFRSYAAANVIAGRTYPEGKAWPAARVSGVLALGRKAPRGVAVTSIDHMAANHFVFRPRTTLRGTRWKLRVFVDAPSPKAGGAAYLIVRNRRGAWVNRPIELNGKGVGSASFTFSRTTVKSAIVTLVNTDTGFRCWKGNPNFSCSGDPTGDNRRYVLRGRVSR